MAGPLGSTPGIIVGVGVGAAASAALQPAIELPRQNAWKDNANRILDVTALARLVAQGGLDHTKAIAEALRDGYKQDKLDALIYAAQTTPPIAEALTLWRRFDDFPDELWTHALVKAGIDPRYYPFLNRLKHAERLDPAVVATAIQRTVLPNPGILPNQPPTAGSNVPPMPVVALDVEKEAASAGLDLARLEVLARIVGLPASPDLAARMHFRNIITEGAFNQAILEGNTRGEWAPFLLDGFREILTAHDYAELQLRGFLTEAQRHAGTAKHGMSQADSDLLFDVLGRAPSVHQVVIGLARGAVYPATYADVPQPYRAAIQRSNIREEWVDVAYHARYGYPSGFQIRSEAQKGDLTAAETEQILLEVGWSPRWAAFFAAKWTGGTVAVADPHVAKAQTQLWNTTHRSYLAEEIGDSDATTRFVELGLDAAAQSAVLALWQSERSLTRARLSLGQLKKAFTGRVTNPKTGQPWSAADVTAALLDRGYSQADAQTILSEW